LQPDLPGAWSFLAEVLGYEGRFDASLAAGRRAMALGGDESGYAARFGRLLLYARRYGEVDSLAAHLATSTSREVRSDALDLMATMQRELGELRASSRTFLRLVAVDAGAHSMLQVHADNLARLGHAEAAAR